MLKKKFVGQGMLPVLKFWAIAISVVWIAGFGWLEFVARDSSSSYDARTRGAQASRCSGSYSARYDCRAVDRPGRPDGALFRVEQARGRGFPAAAGARLPVRQVPAARREQKLVEDSRRAMLRKRAAARA